MRVPLHRVRQYVPLTVLAFAAVSGAITVTGTEFTDVFTADGRISLFNPFAYTVNLFFHAGGWSHYAGNMVLWLPFGTVLTWLTSNRHVLGLALLANFLTVIVAIPIEGAGLGMSHVVFAVAAAALVRSSGYALQNASTDALQSVLLGLLVPVLGAFLLILVLAGPRRIADFYHFLGFLFGAAIEAMYVFDDHESDAEDPSIPRRIGR